MCVLFCGYTRLLVLMYICIYILIVSIVSSMYREREREGIRFWACSVFDVSVWRLRGLFWGVIFFFWYLVFQIFVWFEMIDLFSDKHKQSNTYRYLSERSENNEKKNRN